VLRVNNGITQSDNMPWSYLLRVEETIISGIHPWVT